MARPSKLTEKQWAEVEKRHLAGEKMRPLAREYGVSEAAIRARVSARSAEIKSVANQIVETEQRFNSLSVSSQIAARSLANELMAISEHLASAGKYGAMTAHRLSGIAHGQIEQIDDAEPERSMEALQRIGVLTKMANSSAEIGLNLLRANKETVEAINRDADTPEPKQVVFTVEDASA